jgi:hypothetical protein
MMRHLILLTVVFSATLPSASTAQRVDDLPTGAKVRLVLAGGGEARGFVNAVTPEVISLHIFERANTGSAVEFRRERIKAMEVMRKHTGKGAIRGGVLGLLIGGGGGFLIGALAYSDNDCNIVVCSAASSGALLGFIGAVVGTPLGLLAGAAHGAPEWQPVYLNP